jgi:hypothetical protein
MVVERLQRTFGAVRDFLPATIAIAGLILCLSVMHGMHAEHSASATAVSPSTTVSADAVYSAAVATGVAVSGDTHVSHGAGWPVGALECEGPCGNDPLMTALQCAFALLLPLGLGGGMRAGATWNHFLRRMTARTKRLGHVSPLEPPSLLLLSICRT